MPGYPKFKLGGNGDLIPLDSDGREVRQERGEFSSPTLFEYYHQRTYLLGNPNVNMQRALAAVRARLGRAVRSVVRSRIVSEKKVAAAAQAAPVAQERSASDEIRLLTKKAEMVLDAISDFKYSYDESESNAIRCSTIFNIIFHERSLNKILHELNGDFSEFNDDDFDYVSSREVGMADLSDLDLLPEDLDTACELLFKNGVSDEMPYGFCSIDLSGNRNAEFCKSLKDCINLAKKLSRFGVLRLSRVGMSASQFSYFLYNLRRNCTQTNLKVIDFSHNDLGDNCAKGIIDTIDAQAYRSIFPNLNRWVLSGNRFSSSTKAEIEQKAIAKGVVVEF